MLFYLSLSQCTVIFAKQRNSDVYNSMFHYINLLRLPSNKIRCVETNSNIRKDLIFKKIKFLLYPKVYKLALAWRFIHNMAFCRLITFSDMKELSGRARWVYRCLYSQTPAILAPPSPLTPSLIWLISVWYNSRPLWKAVWPNYAGNWVTEHYPRRAPLTYVNQLNFLTNSHGRVAKHSNLKAW
jgi:hypothetical protein